MADVSTHWGECWTVHHDCARAKVERLWTVANDLRTLCSALLRGVPVRNADEVFVAADRVLGTDGDTCLGGHTPTITGDVPTGAQSDGSSAGASNAPYVNETG